MRDLVFDRISQHYLAGIIDADGCITLNKDKERYRPRIRITMRDYSFLAAIKEYLTTKLSINSCLSKKPRKNHNAKDCYDLVVSAKQDLLALVNYLRYYIIVKYDRLLYLEKFLSLSNNQEDTEQKEFIFLKMKELNKRGISNEVSTAI